MILLLTQTLFVQLLFCLNINRNYFIKFETLGKMNIVFRVYFYSMWFVGTPVMIIFILVNTFISYDTIAGYYGFDNPDDGIEIYPAWCNNFGQ